MTFWEGKRVLVTGATGLLGSHLTKALVGKGADVTILVRDEPKESLLIQSPEWRQATLVRGALQSFPTLLRALTGIEIVFHLGAQTQVTHANAQPLETFESNVRGTYNLLEACRQHGSVTKIVVASSDKAYGSHEQLPYAEDAPLRGLHPYDVSKSCTDLIAQTYGNTYGLPVCILRCGNIYGPGDYNFMRIVPEALKAGVEGKTLAIRSDGTFVRDYVYVADIVDGYLAAAETTTPPGDALNLGTGERVRVLDVVKAVSDALGKEIETDIRNEAKGEIRDQYLSSEKAKDVLGWEPKHDLASGLKKTAPAYAAFLRTGRWQQ